MINYEMGLRLDPQLFPKIITRTAKVAFRLKFCLEYYGQSLIMYKSAFANKFIRNTHCRVHASHKNLMMLAFVVTQTTQVSHKIIKQFVQPEYFKGRLSIFNMLYLSSKENIHFGVHQFLT